MNRQVNLLSFLFLFPFFVFAQEKEVGIVLPVAKTPYLSIQDTILVQVGNLNQKTFNHIIKRGQTLYGLSKFYGMTLDDIFFYNPYLRKVGLSLNQKVILPISNSAIIRIANQELNTNYYIPVCYIVKPKETLYTISKSYFSMSPLLMQKNNIKSSTNLGIGDTLLIGWMKLDGVPKEIATKSNTIRSEIHNENAPYRLKYQEELTNKKEIKENGIAFWKEQGTAKGKLNFLALHRTAHLGSIIKILNPMTGKTYYAKVTGRIPDSTYEPTIKVVLSPSLAKSLGAIDPKFHVKITTLK